MSDAQLPPDADDEESDPSDRSALRLTDAGMIVPPSLEIPNEDPLEQAPAFVPDAEVNGSANESSPHLVIPGEGAQATASEAASDDLQPMLDLRFPDPSSSDPVPLHPLTWEHPDRAPVGPSLQEIEPEPSGLEPPALSESSEPGQWHADMSEAPAVAGVTIEISPIFSALDAAEAAHQREPAPEPDAFETGISLPRSQLADGEETVAPADSPLALQPPATDPPEVDGNPDAGSTTENEASPEIPQDSAAPHDAEEQPAPAEILQDAAARIAAEASATAAALENLKRLLAHNRSEPHIAVLPHLLEASPERTEPPPIPAYRPPAHLPVTPPPMVPTPLAAATMPFSPDEEPPRRAGAAVGSFFAGFALSWVFGAVLYVFLTAG